MILKDYGKVFLYLIKKKLKRLSLLNLSRGSIMAISWKKYIEDCNRVGLESPIPYKVIPYKNGVGIKKIVFIKPIKNHSL